MISEEQAQRSEENPEGEDDGQDDVQDGEGAGPAENLEEDPAYNPQGPERKYKGG